MPDGPFALTGPKLAGRMDDWTDFMEQRQKYLEQAWNATRWATDSVDPRFTTINQVSSSYAPGDTTDGVDTRQDRPYDVLSGHGGYSDNGYGTMFPVRSAEAYHGYSWDKPHYYLPTWGAMGWAAGATASGCRGSRSWRESSTHQVPIIRWPGARAVMTAPIRSLKSPRSTAGWRWSAT